VAQAADRENLIKHTLDKYGAIDILINNAGIFP
jgi:NAD(P)-dependent dehydrogenase (short-subunit alcohol dehydrogenase family)